MNKIKHFTCYEKVCRDGESGNVKKLMRLLNCKQLFSIPWLLAHDILLEGYPVMINID